MFHGQLFILGRHLGINMQSANGTETSKMENLFDFLQEVPFGTPSFECNHSPQATSFSR